MESFPAFECFKVDEIRRQIVAPRHSAAVRAAALNHEIRNHAVEISPRRTALFLLAGLSFVKSSCLPKGRRKFATVLALVFQQAPTMLPCESQKLVGSCRPSHAIFFVPHHPTRAEWPGATSRKIAHALFVNLFYGRESQSARNRRPLAN